jgi:hypothetical protein
MGVQVKKKAAEDNYVLKKRRKWEPERRNMQPLGENA